MKGLKSESMIKKKRQYSLDTALRRRQLMFLASVGLFVVLTSFCYGLLKGIEYPSTAEAFSGISVEKPLTWHSAGDSENLPGGVRVMPLGRNTAINGKPTTMISFVSDRRVRELLSEQVKKWERSGLYTFGMGRKRRGTAFAVDKRSGKRFVLSVWRVPQGIRSIVSDGMPVQGMLSTAEPGLAAEEGLRQDYRGVPGVPLREGSVSGAVFSAQEYGSTSYSGLYTNPGSLEDNLAFYREVLISDGWKEVSGDMNWRAGVGGAYLCFYRGKEEIVLLFSPMDRFFDGESKTVLVAARGPQGGQLAAANHY